jgi:hypothetical protein
MRLFPRLAGLLALLIVPAQAVELPAPGGPVVLTINGAIVEKNGDGGAAFDQAMLDALPQRTTVTQTPWYDQEQSFSGVLLKSLLDRVGAQGTSITVTAINDYSAEIPFEDFAKDPVILASRLNGSLLSVRDKGPLFVIYPFDLDPDLNNEVLYGRSVWQVTSITVH